jgi:hypothetical protein
MASGGESPKKLYLFQEMAWEKSENPQPLRLRPVLKVSACCYLSVFY